MRVHEGNELYILGEVAGSPGAATFEGLRAYSQPNKRDQRVAEGMA